MLDSIILEKAGIPAISIVTDAFDSTAKEMAEIWGLPNFEFVTVPHPLGNLTPAEIERRVDEAIDKVTALLQKGQPD